MKYERIKFLVIALKNAVEVYAWAPKPYHKFMAFKVETSFVITHNYLHFCVLNKCNYKTFKFQGELVKIMSYDAFFSFFVRVTPISFRQTGQN